MIAIAKSETHLFSSIENDKISNVPTDQRYPIRLIFVNNFQTFNSIIKYLNKHSKLIELSSLLPHNDGWITPDELIRLIKGTKFSALVVPVSEILRFTRPDIFNSVLVSLFEIENSQDNLENRIYIPMLGLWDRFEKEFYENFHRKNEWSTIWKIDEQLDKQTTIYQINFPVETKRTLIKTSSDWFNLWKCTKIDYLISSSKSLGYLYKNFLPDSIFSMEELFDYKAFIDSFLKVKISIEYSEKEIEYWRKLSIDLESKNKKDKQCSNLEAYISDYFNIKDILELTYIDLLNLYLNNNSKYSRWILKSWILSNAQYMNNYLYHIISGTKNFTDDEFIRNTWFMIFHNNNYIKENFKERKEIITLLHVQLSLAFSFIETNLSIQLNKIENLSFYEQSEYLTNITIAEREHIITQLTKQEDLPGNLTVLEKIYPELYYYLSWDMPLNELEGIQWIKEYFKEYCISKLLDKPTDRLTYILNEKNSDTNTFYNWYYNINFYPDFKDVKVIWIDGLGAEWLSILHYIIGKYLQGTDKLIKNTSIVKVNLPSITDCNRFDDAEHLLDLDNYIHHEKPYKYPRSLIEQIELLNKIVKNKILKYPDNRIIIVSDHGFTFLAQKKYGNFKKFNFEYAEHEGRFLWTEKEFKSDSNFLFHTIDKGPYKNKKALLSLKHISLQDTPYREVHGGATPEEVLVPYIEIATIQERIVYEMELLTKEISIQVPKIIVKIAPHPNTIPYFILHEKRYHFEEEKDNWSKKLTGMSPGNYNISIYIDHNHFEVHFKIKGGIEEEELF